MSEPGAAIELTINIADRDRGQRLDQVISARLDSLSRTAIQSALRQGAGRVNGKTGRPAQRLHEGDLVEFRFQPESQTTIVPEPIEFTELDRREEVLVLDKPAGIAVHPGIGNRSGTLANGLLLRYPQVVNVGGHDRPGIVHRLDKGTSGVMLAALSQRAYLYLQAEFAARRVDKRYLAICRGVPNPAAAVIQAPIGRDPARPIAFAVGTARGREATTQYKVLASAADCSLLELRLFTGRTHQARVHMAAIGHPLLGDYLYGGGNHPDRQMLHAFSIGLRLPSGTDLVWRAPLPADFAEYASQSGLEIGQLGLFPEPAVPRP